MKYDHLIKVIIVKREKSPIGSVSLFLFDDGICLVDRLLRAQSVMQSSECLTSETPTRTIDLEVTFRSCSRAEVLGPHLCSIKFKFT